MGRSLAAPPRPALLALLAAAAVLAFAVRRADQGAKRRLRRRSGANGEAGPEGPQGREPGVIRRWRGLIQPTGYLHYLQPQPPLHSQQRQSVHLHSVHWQHVHFFVSVVATFMVFSCGRRDAAESIFNVATMARSTPRRSR
jgi:hypothetical protein